MTPSTRRFLLDANVFIEAYRRYFAFDLCPGFWDFLISDNIKTTIFSIDKVKDELLKGSDELAKWCSDTVDPDFFISTDDPAIIQIYSEIAKWVNDQEQFKDEAKIEFLGIADGWLIACSKEKDMTLVTHEVYTQDARKKVPIPNVCKAFGVKYMDTFEMLRELGVKFQWNP